MEVIQEHKQAVAELQATKVEKKEGVTKTSDLREQLKRVFAQEIAKIPEYLKDMEPGARVTALVKMMPYIFPPLEKCDYWAGENSGFANWDEI